MSAAGSRGRRDSNHTHLSLLHIDPTPMSGFSPAASPIGDLDRSFSVHSLATASDTSLEKSTGSVKGGSAMAPGLSGGGRGAIFYLTRIQRYSSYAMSIFLSLHLANVSVIPAVTRSVPGSETYLLMTREIYQTPVMEPLLVALPVIAHVGSGIALRIARRIQNGRRYGAALPGFFAWRRWASEEGRSVRVWPRLSYVSLSGYALSLFYGAHVFMNRVLPLVFDGSSANIGLGYVAHGFARHPWAARAAYGGLLAFGCGHMVWGMAKWLGVALSGDDRDVFDHHEARSRKRRTWWALQAVVAATLAAWAAGGIGVVSRAGEGEGWIGQLYDHLFAQVGL
ncbi:hypothetical protein ESCO_000050 [Escovopsis weberi]|uniref:Mitochondrial adapter protein MCP1 transmembrane domain-containing protein n=1 Tax=Escovopsis weberi TaxID=150374 RepID=A0A0M8MT82_ESCWE|nr:hypothetical protein ESCO_000050 [Escovopsis weberi]